MSKLSLLKPVLLTGATTLFFAGCVTHEVRYVDRPVAVAAQPAPAAPGSEVVVSGPPPAPIQETITVAPDPTYVWIGGAWAWGPRGWVWGPGHWGPRPHYGAVWVGPRYVYRGGHHVYVR